MLACWRKVFAQHGAFSVTDLRHRLTEVSNDFVVKTSEISKISEVSFKLAQVQDLCQPMTESHENLHSLYKRAIPR